MLVTSRSSIKYQTSSLVLAFKFLVYLQCISIIKEGKIESTQLFFFSDSFLKICKPLDFSELFSMFLLCLHSGPVFIFQHTLIKHSWCCYISESYDLFAALSC